MLLLWVIGTKSWVSAGEMGDNTVRILPTWVSGGEKGEREEFTKFRGLL